MSDGPHRSLPLPKRWQHVMQCAERPHCDNDELDILITNALIKEMKEDPYAFKTLEEVQEATRSLFPIIEANHLDAMENNAFGSSLTKMIVRLIKSRSVLGELHQDYIASSLSDALAQHAINHRRAIVEHVILKGDERQQKDVIGRLHKSLDHFDYKGLAQKLIHQGPKCKTMRIQKKTGLDEGPPK